MKKKILLIPTFLLLLTGCGLNNDYNFENKKYPEGSLTHYLKDDDMVVDGLEDEHYKNCEKFTIYEPEYNITFTTQTYFGEHGLYFYCHLNDTTVYYNRYENAEPYNNDGVEMHISVKPQDTLKVENLSKFNKIQDDMIQIRSDVTGKVQTWVGNHHQHNNLYVWTQYYKPIEIGVHVEGKANRVNAATGYAIELYCPYSNFGLTTAPSEISIMPAFNNANDDAYRKWFTFKGMSHDKPSSWMNISKEEGFNYPGLGIEPSMPLTADPLDSKYDGQMDAKLYETDENNNHPELRATHKMFLGMDGIYTQFILHDKKINQYSDSIYENDGVEFYVDTVRHHDTDTHHPGIFRFVLDVDNGIQTDIAVEGFNDNVPYRIGTTSKVSIDNTPINGLYGYNYTYCLEVFIPYESLGLTYRSDLIVNTAFAYKSPGEASYMLKTSGNKQEAREIFYIDQRYPWNPAEYFYCTRGGLE